MSHSHHRLRPRHPTTLDVSELVDAVADAVAERVLSQLVPQLRDALEAPPYMQTEEAAAYVRLPLGTFRAQVARGRISRSQPGKRVIYTRSDLDEFVERHRIERLS